MSETTELARRARDWAERRIAGEGSPDWYAVQFILATVDSPTPTLAEELRAWAEGASYDEDRDNLLHAATRAEKMEHDLAEASAEVERLSSVNENLRKTDNYREFREAFLTVQKGAESDTESNAETPNPADVPVGEAWIVEVDGKRRNAIKDFFAKLPWTTVTDDGCIRSKGNESVTLISRLVPAPRVITTVDAPAPNPADVPVGEAWLLEVDGKRRTAVKDGTTYVPWRTVGESGAFSSESEEDITLLHRLVPAPRTITTEAALDRAKRRTVIRDADGVVCERDSMGDAWSTFTSLADQRPHITLPATVLWEPEV